MRAGPELNGFLHGRPVDGSKVIDDDAIGTRIDHGRIN